MSKWNLALLIRYERTTTTTTRSFMRCTITIFTCKSLFTYYYNCFSDRIMDIHLRLRALNQLDSRAQEVMHHRSHILPHQFDNHSLITALKYVLCLHYLISRIDSACVPPCINCLDAFQEINLLCLNKNPHTKASYQSKVCKRKLLMVSNIYIVSL